MKSFGDESLTAEKKDTHLNSLWVRKWNHTFFKNQCTFDGELVCLKMKSLYFSRTLIFGKLSTHSKVIDFEKSITSVMVNILFRSGRSFKISGCLNGEGDFLIWLGVSFFWKWQLLKTLKNFHFTDPVFIKQRFFLIMHTIPD